MKKYYRYSTSIAVLLIIFMFQSLSVLKQDIKFSMLEGRTLQAMPSKELYVTDENEYDEKEFVKSIMNGEYFRKWDRYFSDQTVLRETLVNQYTRIQKNNDKKYINGVYLGEDEYLFSIPNLDYDYVDIEERINHFNSLQDEFISSKIYIAVYPSKDMLYPELVPIKGYISEEKKYLDKILQGLDSNKIKALDFYDVAKGKSDLYYKTDHHWNMDGTYLGYKSIIELMSKEFTEIGLPKDEGYYNINTFEKHFVGSDGRKIGQAVDTLEDIKLYRFDDEINMKVTINGEEGKLYNTEYLSEDKYNNDYVTYLKGDNGETIIENTKSNNDIVIAIIGESMDNPLIPLMSVHFNKTYSYDLRDYKEDINKALHDLEPDIILINGLPGGFLSSDDTLLKIK